MQWLSQHQAKLSTVAMADTAGYEKSCDHLSLSWEHSPEDLIHSTRQNIGLYSNIIESYAMSQSSSSSITLTLPYILRLFQLGRIIVTSEQSKRYTVETALRQLSRHSSLYLLQSVMSLAFKSNMRRSDQDNAMGSRSDEICDMSVTTFHDLDQLKDTIDSHEMSPDVCNSSRLYWQLYRIFCEAIPSQRQLFQVMTDCLMGSMMKRRLSILLRYSLISWDRDYLNRRASQLILRWIIDRLV